MTLEKRASRRHMFADKRGTTIFSDLSRSFARNQLRLTIGLVLITLQVFCFAIPRNGGLCNSRLRRPVTLSANDVRGSTSNAAELLSCVPKRKTWTPENVNNVEVICLPARPPSTRTYAAEILIIYIVIQSLSKRLVTSQLPVCIRNESVGTTISRFSLSKSASIRKIHEFLISIERVYLHGKFEWPIIGRCKSGAFGVIGSDKADNLL